MKILQVLSSLCPGGAEGFVTNLSVSLSELDADVRVYVLAGARGERGKVLLTRLRDAGVNVLGAEERKPASLKNLTQLIRLIRSWRPDIVHANLYPSEVACAVAKILSLHSKTSYMRRLANTEFVGYRSPTIVRILDRFFPHTIACSPSVANAYRDFMCEKQQSEIITIPNGGLLLDSIPDVTDKQNARYTLDIDEQAFVIAHIGRMSGRDRVDSSLARGQKAQDVLLRAFARAFGRDSNAVLALVGDGPLRSEAEALAQNLKIENQVRFMGQQPEPWSVLTAANMFCFPSRYEGLPNVLPEAASCGLPVVASDIPEIRFLYPGDAWLLRPANDIEAFANAMLTVRANLEMFVTRARKVAHGFREQFSMTACAKKYLLAYRSALEGNETDRH